MRRAALVALLASTATGAALAQGAPAPMGGDSRWSVSAEALFAWFKSSPTPVPIITDSYVDAPDVNVLLGGGSVDTNPNAGFKITGAYRIDSRLGVELTGFYIPTRTHVEQRELHRPARFHRPVPAVLRRYDQSGERHRDFLLARVSRQRAGNAVEQPRRRRAQRDMGDAAAGRMASRPPRRFRFLQLRESYTITTSSPYNPPNPVDIWNTTDAFDARNRFYGLQVGARAAYDQGPWVGSVIGKLALGTMQQRVSVNGFLETNDYNDYGPTQIFPGGYFALPTNSGDHSRNTFAVVPEVALNLGYRLTPQATVYVGYSFLYASNVARPGDQINRNINPTQTVSYGNDPPVTPVGAAQPTFNFNTTDFWAQTLSIGLAYRF